MCVSGAFAEPLAVVASEYGGRGGVVGGHGGWAGAKRGQRAFPEPQYDCGHARRAKGLYW